MDDLKKIQEEIIKDFGLENIPEEKRVAMIETIGKLIFQAVLMRAMEKMNENDQDELGKIVDENSQPEKVFGFLKEKIENFEEIIKEEVARLKNETLETMSLIK